MGGVFDKIGVGALVDKVGDFATDIYKGVTGETAADAIAEGQELQETAAQRAISVDEAGREQALEFFAPFQGVGESAIEQSSFLTDPQEQYDFLQSNPIFQSALSQAQDQTLGIAAAQGRLSAGDTLEQLNQNLITTATPLISQQSSNISNLLNLGFGTAQSQANAALGSASNISNLLQNLGNVQASGSIAAANAQTQGIQNLLGAGATIAGAYISDPRLKEDIQFDSVQNGVNVYRWKWNKTAKELFGLVGESFGVMADEVKRARPEAIINVDGVDMVNYDMIEVQHGT